MKVLTKYQSIWYRAVHLTICRLIEVRIKSIGNSDPTQLIHLRWRLAYNLYFSGNSIDASKIFESICNIDEDTDQSQLLDHEISLSKNSEVHQIAGRCSVELFLSTSIHYHLENAYKHYENAVNTMPANLFTMYKLPTLLLEFGVVLEYYGAFESAIEVYSRVMTNFPNFKGYFDALYRTAIVSQHLARLMAEGPKREEQINQCIDIFQFLLEALPSDISDIHAVLMYGRTLELSANPTVQYRAIGIYNTLYDLCKKQRVADAHKQAYKTSKLWLEDTINWFKLGDTISAQGEFLIAQEAYSRYVEEQDKIARYGINKHNYSMDVCLRLAKQFAFFQNYEEAIKYLEIGLTIDRYHKETRFLLAKWSNIRSVELNRESHAIQNIINTWKGRCWTGGFVRKLKQNVIAEQENKLQEDRFDLRARDQLSYYAKRKYRPKFLYEEYCAIKIQRTFRRLRKAWAWQEVQYRQYENKASELYRRYAKDSFDPVVREEIKQLMKNRLAPKKNHPIIAVRKEIETQELAKRSIKRGIQAYSIRRALWDRIKHRYDTKNKVINDAATKIASVVRMKLSHAIIARMIETRRVRLAAVATIEKFIIWRNSTFQHSVTRTYDRLQEIKLQKQKSMRVLKALLPARIKAYLKRKQSRIFAAAVREMQLKAAAEKKKLERRQIDAVNMIQRFYRTVHSNFISKLSTHIINLRRQVVYSLSTTTHLMVVKHNLKTTQYRNPGMNKTSAQYNALLQQHTVYCNETFTAIDCLMLSMVLKHTYCNIKHLVLHNISDSKNPCYEFDLLTALNNNKSLTALSVIGGAYTESFINGVIYCIQVENPRITTLVIEKLHNSGIYSDNIGVYCGRLLLDYFNFCIPGIHTLSLHGCSLRDNQMDMIVSGIKVNTSITELILSLNIITDIGFNAIFNAICENKKSKIKKLDFSYNLIKCNHAMLQQLKAYVHNNLQNYLTVYLINNIIYKQYNSSDNIFKTSRTHIKIIYHYKDIEEVELKQHHTHLESYNPKKKIVKKTITDNAFFTNAVRSIIPVAGVASHITHSSHGSKKLNNNNNSNNSNNSNSGSGSSVVNGNKKKQMLLEMRNKDNTRNSSNTPPVGGQQRVNNRTSEKAIPLNNSGDGDGSGQKLLSRSMLASQSMNKLG